MNVKNSLQISSLWWDGFTEQECGIVSGKSRLLSSNLSQIRQRCVGFNFSAKSVKLVVTGSLLSSSEIDFVFWKIKGEIHLLSFHLH